VVDANPSLQVHITEKRARPFVTSPHRTPQDKFTILENHDTKRFATDFFNSLLDLPEAAPWTGNWWHLIATWLFGAVIFAGLVTFIMHFGAIEVFAAKLRGANPLAAALACQLATYVSAAAVWFRVLKRAGSPLPFLSLLRLAFVELFANQAVPTGGLSGSFMVIRCLMRRGIASAVAVTAQSIAALSYYAAYFMVGLLSSCFGIAAT
jgi:glycosyltransferase 2 family protein